MVREDGKSLFICGRPLSSAQEHRGMEGWAGRLLSFFLQRAHCGRDGRLEEFLILYPRFFLVFFFEAERDRE